MKLIFICVFFFSSALEASTVRTSSPTSPVAYASNSSSAVTLGIVAEGPNSGDGTSETDPIKVYVPMGGTGASGAGLEQRNKLILSPSTRIPLNPGTGASYVLIKLALSNSTGSLQYLKAAVKTASSASTSFKVISLETGFTVGANSTANVDSVFNIVNMCLLTTVVDCSSINKAITVAGQNNGEFIFYYFLSATDHASDTSITPSVESGGVFVKYHFSDVLPVGSTTLNKLYNGDGRVFIDFNSATNMTQMGDKIYKTMIYKHTGVVSADATNVGTSGVANIQALIAPTMNGLLDIQNLINDTDYYFSVSQVNKFSFHSPMSASLLAHPEPIEALLKKQACFLLTAGFLGNHPVVEYFRMIRDHYLLNFTLGKIFVNSYYSWAPRYAQTILNRPWLAAIIRGSAHTVYFILHHLIVSSMVFLVLLFLLLMKKFQKTW